MNKEEQAFYFLLDDYMQIPKTWEDYQIIKKAIAENKQLKDNWNKLKEWMQKELVDSKATSGYSFYLKSWLDKMQEIEGGMNE